VPPVPTPARHSSAGKTVVIAPVLEPRHVITHPKRPAPAPASAAAG
jgi:hypothetical protein